METDFNANEKRFIVIDCGSGYMKAGYSGEDSPWCILPTVVGCKQIKEEVIGQQDSYKTIYMMGNPKN